MSTDARRRKIQEYLSGHDELTVEAAVKEFHASPATIRRDFAEISANGGVRRIRGGICRLRNEKDNMIPFILVDKKFWSGFLRWVRTSLIENDMIAPEDLELIKLVDTAEEAVDYLGECHRYGPHGTVLRD